MGDALSGVSATNHDLRQCEGALAVLHGEPRFHIANEPVPPCAVRSERPAPCLADWFVVDECDDKVEAVPARIGIKAPHESLDRVKRVAALYAVYVRLSVDQRNSVPNGTSRSRI